MYIQHICGYLVHAIVYTFMTNTTTIMWQRQYHTKIERKSM